MRKMIESIALILSSIRLIPHVLLLAVTSQDDLRGDVKRWNDVYFKNTSQGFWLSFLKLMTRYPEFRNIFYYRMGLLGKIFRPLCPQMNTLFIASDHIGPGLFIQHGFATIIAAKSIGSNCWVNQQVTIGYSAHGERPTIGDDVVVNAGAKIVGGVSVGNGVTVGANTVVVKSVPNGVTVVGAATRIVRENGKKVDRTL